MPKTKKKSDAVKRKENRVAHQALRSDPEYREQERGAFNEARSLAREDPDYRHGEYEAFNEARRQAREDPEFRREEYDARNEARQQAREDPEFRREEYEAKNEARREAREDSDYRQEEYETFNEARRQAREDPDYRRKEYDAFNEARRQAREDPGYTQRENESRQQRNDIPEKRQSKRLQESEAKKKTREEPSFRSAENLQQKARYVETTSDPEQRKRLIASIVESASKRLKTSRASFENLLPQYLAKIKLAPEHICSSCGGLFYKQSVTAYDLDKLAKRGVPEELQEQVLCVTAGGIKFCSTCKSSIFDGKVPRLCLFNGLDFPPTPPELAELRPLEERLVALRIPFMQIRLLGSERQSTLKGNVVNIENDLDVCATAIPRQFHQTSTVQVQLMRRLCYSRPYMYEVIRPFVVQVAARYLASTELYQDNNVQVQNIYRDCEEGFTIDFIVSEGDRVPTATPDILPESRSESNNDTNGNRDNEADEDEVSANEDDDANVIGADETLFVRPPPADFRGIRIAPGERKRPLPIYADEYAEEMSFPKIYCGRKRKFKDGVKLTYTDIAKSEARNHSRKACTPTKLLYSFKRSYNEKARSAVQVYLRKTSRQSNLKASDVKTADGLKRVQGNDEGYAVWKNLRSSPAYWAAKCKKVVAMVRQRGKCAFFITLSAAETRWPELLVMLMKIVKGKDVTEDEAMALSNEEKAELIRSDPVTCMRNFDHRYRALLHLLLKPDAGLFSPYALEDFFNRIEFQLRGSPHCHGLYWLKDAPVYIEGDPDSELACIIFIDTYITCNRNVDGKLAEYIKYQIHKHSHTCRKKLKRNLLCRFAYPKPPLPRTMILQPFPKITTKEERKKYSSLYETFEKLLNDRGRNPSDCPSFEEFLSSLDVSETDYINAIRSSIRRTTVFLKRQVDEAFVNAYNPKLLEAWGANIDIQFVLDTYACAKYCVGYILKAEGGMSKLLRDAAASARRGNLTIQEKLKQFAKILLTGTEVSAQEAAAFILGIPNTHCSRGEVFVSTSPVAERTSILKSKDQLEKLEDESNDIFAKGLLDHYVQRPDGLENVCLASFAANYDFSKTTRFRVANEEGDDHAREMDEAFNADEKQIEPAHQLKDKSGYVRKRTVTKIVRFRHYGKEEDPLNYWREQLMLFVPWRNEELELIDINVHEKALSSMETLLENSKIVYHDREIGDEQLRDLMNESEEDNDGVNDEEPDQYAEDDDYLIEDMFRTPARKSNTRQRDTNDLHMEQFLPPKEIPNAEYIGLMRSLNEKQRRFVLNVLHLLKTYSQPFNFFLSGGAGVGKSHVITAIVQSSLRFFRKKYPETPADVAVIVAAPTGKSAFNVFGMTCHTAFRLQPLQNREPTTDLDDSRLSTVRTLMAGVKLIIIDEISMVNVRQLYDIDQRLRQIFSTDMDFGNKSVIVVGHLRQLPPIAAKYVFQDPDHLPLAAAVGNHLWPKFTFYELDEIMRQRGDWEFCKALNNMSEGKMDEADIQLIKSREISEALQPPIDSVWLFLTNKLCAEYNKKIHDTLDTLGATSTAVDKLQGTGTAKQKEHLLEKLRSLSQSECDGLPFETHLKVGGEYFISTNINVADGLFNGATGSLKAIEFQRAVDGSDNQRPYGVWMDFRNPLIGAEKRKASLQRLEGESRETLERTTWVPVERMIRRLNKTSKTHGLSIVRDQIPLVACNGMTVAKSQGSSMPLVVVNTTRQRGGRKLTREEMYVACSRATSLNGLFINGEFEAPQPPNPDKPNEKGHLVTLELERLRAKPFQFKLKFLQDYGNSFHKIYFQNVQWLLPHISDIASDQCAMAADVLAFVEPHLLSTDNVSISGYQVSQRVDCSSSRSASEGIVVFEKDSLDVAIDQKVVRTDFLSTTQHCILHSFRIQDVNIVVLYKSPKHPNPRLMQLLTNYVWNLDGKTVCVGDFNIDLNDKFRGVFRRRDYHSLLDPTEHSHDLGNQIDWCFANFDGVEAWYYESYFSDHKAVCITIPK